MANRDFVVGSTSNKETCADMDRGTVASSLFDSVPSWKRDRDQNVLERKVGLALKREK